MSETRQPEPEVRLAELVAALSLGVDLGFGQPMEHVLRECMIALRLADRLQLNEKERSTVYYSVRDPRMSQLLVVAKQLLATGLRDSQALLVDLENDIEVPAAGRRRAGGRGR